MRGDGTKAVLLQRIQEEDGLKASDETKETGEDDNDTDDEDDEGGEGDSSVGCHQPGLVNAGITCFFNAIMQALFSCDSFREGIENDEGGTPVQKQLRALFARLEAVRRKGAGSVTPTAMLTLLRKTDSVKELMYKESDCQEFVMGLMSELSPETHGFFTGSMVKYNSGTPQCNPFTFDLVLPLFSSVAESVRSLFNPQVRDDVHTHHLQLLTPPPPILALYFQRFTRTGRTTHTKNTVDIDVDLSLDLSEYCIKSKPNTSLCR